MMHGYGVRFEQGRGRFIVLQSKRPSDRSNIDELQLKLMQTFEVPGLLPINVFAMDDSISFRYEWTGTRLLSQTLRTGRWKMTGMLEAVCRLAELLEQAHHYALDEERIVLEDEFVFVGAEWHDIRLIYLPVRDVNPDEPISARLERLLVRWLVHVSDADGPTIRQLLDIASSSDFTPATLRAFARHQLASGSPLENSSAGPGEARPQPRPDNKAEFGWRRLQPQSDPQTLSGLLADGAAGRNDSDRHGSIWRKFVDEEMAEEMGDERVVSAITEQSSAIRRRRIILLCAFIAVSACGWKWLYIEAYSKAGLWLALGVTLFAASGVLALWGVADSWKTPFQKFPASRQNDQESDEPGQSVMNREMTESPPLVRPAGKSDEAELFPSLLSAVPMALTETQWLPGQPDATSLLGEAASDKAVSPSYFLEWETGEQSRIPLAGPALVIGRSTDAAQHVDQSEGISRAHLEIWQSPEGWKAKDLGSRNGTTLNEQPMAPYEPYLLSPNDSLRLAADSRYRFLQSGGRVHI